jgi:ribosomal protein S10
MAKSIIITYNEADESLLMALFQKFKIKIESYNTQQQAQTVDSSTKMKEEVKNDIREAVSEMQAHLRGETDLPDFWESLNRIKKELAEEKNK